ncbi:MAG: FtsH protease activity modulator HflK [Alphaproteobacteria bacterium]|nr:MAG: FtsH protease activity modulator HflK [Alphaproteobacteria bacterium]
MSDQQDKGPWGPWGSNGNNGAQGGAPKPPPRRPSNDGPGQQPPLPPDIEQLLLQGQAKLRRLMPGGRPPRSNTSWIFLLLGGLAAAWLLSGIYFVREGQQSVVLCFGKPIRTEESGMRYHLPAPIEMALTADVSRSRGIEIGFKSDSRGGERGVPEESLMLTGDENIVEVKYVVFWQVQNLTDFLFNIRPPLDSRGPDPDATIKKVAESAMRETIARNRLQPAMTDARTQIEDDTKRMIQKIMDDYKSGILITQVQLRQVDPPAQVIESFNDVQSARADKERLENQAMTYTNDILPKARGEASRIRQEAEGYREQVVNVAKGEAERFAKVWQVYTLSKDTTSRRLYLETMEQVLRQTPKVIVDGKAAPGAAPYMPLALPAAAPAPAAAARATE